MPNHFRNYIILIFGLFFVHVYSQNLELKIIGNDSTETKVIDSLGYNSYFKDYRSLNTEVDSIHKRLLNIGFIKSKLLELKKQNDTSFLATFNLKT
ncbi:MAG: hypothetical protein WBF67_11205, partial [Olleya sp.]